MAKLVITVDWQPQRPPLVDAAAPAVPKAFDDWVHRSLEQLGGQIHQLDRRISGPEAFVRPGARRRQAREAAELLEAQDRLIAAEDRADRADAAARALTGRAV